MHEPAVHGVRAQIDGSNPTAAEWLGFRVGHWMLALEAAGTGAVLAWPPPLARLPGAPPWLIGVMTDNAHPLPVVDLAALIEADADSTHGATHTLICATDPIAIPISAPRPLGAHGDDELARECDPVDVPAAITGGRVRISGARLERFDSAAVVALAIRRSASWWRAREGETDDNQH